MRRRPAGVLRAPAIAVGVAVGGSCLALLAAARAGLGVAPLGRMVGGELPDCGPSLGLPPLPASRIILLARTSGPHLAAAARTPAASARDSLR